MSSTTVPRTPANAAAVPSTPPCPSKPAVAKHGVDMLSSGDTDTDTSSPLSSPPSSLSSATPSPLSSPSPCGGGLLSSLTALTGTSTVGFVTARDVYEKQVGTLPAVTASVREVAGSNLSEVMSDLGVTTLPASTQSEIGAVPTAMIPLVAKPPGLALKPVPTLCNSATVRAATGEPGVTTVEPLQPVPTLCDHATSPATTAVPVAVARMQADVTPTDNLAGSVFGIGLVIPSPPQAIGQTTAVSAHGTLPLALQGTPAGMAVGATDTAVHAVHSSAKGKQREDNPAAEPASVHRSDLLPSPMAPDEHVATPPVLPPPVPSVGNNIPMRDNRVDFAAAEAAASTTNGTAPQSAASRLALKLEYARVAASARQWYLAQGASLQTLTAWYRTGRGSIRVSAAAAAAAEEAQAAHAADPHLVRCPAPLGPAGYGLIGQLEDDFFFGRCDGNYRGPSPMLGWNRNFAQTTLTFALGPPPAQYPSLVNDYDAAVGTLVSLLPANANVKSGHVYENKPGKHLRLRHTIFEPRSAAGANGVTGAMPGNASAAMATGPQIPSEFSIEDWPCFTDEAQAARDAIVETHVARPLPAYDVFGNLILPSRYHLELRGATVLVSFSMTHYDIAQRRANGTHATKCTICLDIQYLRVLIPPTQSSSMKRSNVHLSDPISSSSKKPRF